MFKGKFNKNFLTGILASLAINMVGGVAVEKKYQDTKQEEIIKDRELVKDVIFLPANEEELVQNLLEQAGVKNISEIQKNPELVKKIDLGIFFIQVEFLENKIDAKQAKMAILNLQLQEKVFSDLYKKTNNPLLVINELQNNIADPQIFLDENDKIESNEKSNGNDYKKVEALLSSYLLHGQSNCYGSIRALISLLTKILPEHKFKINELDLHARVVVQEKNNSYLVDTGTPIKKVTPDDLVGTILYEDAHLAFLSGILKLPNPQKYYDIAGNDSLNSAVNLDETDSKSEEKAIYKNTSIGNFFDYTPTQLEGKKQLKSLTNLPIPAQADRQRVQLSSELEKEQTNTDSNLKTTDELGPTDINKIIKAEIKAVKIEIIKNESAKNETTTEKKETHDFKTANTNEISTPTNEQKNKFLILEADPMILAFIRESIEVPSKKEENAKEILLWLQKLDRSGVLEQYIEQITNENKKLGALRPKAEEKDNPYLMAKFLVEDHIAKYKELKNKVDDKEIIKNAEILLLKYLNVENKIFNSASPDNDNPLAWKEISIKDIPGISKKVKEHLSRSKKGYGISFYHNVDKESANFLFKIAKENPPRSIEINGESFPSLEELQLLLDLPTAKDVVVKWHNPAPGTDLSPIWKAISEQRIQFEDDQYVNGRNSMQDPTKKFSMVDAATKTIVNVNTPEMRTKFGKVFIYEFLLRQAMHDQFTTKSSTIKIESKVFFPESVLSTFGLVDFYKIQNMFDKFYLNSEPGARRSYEFISTGEVKNKDNFNFINQFNFKNIEGIADTSKEEYSVSIRIATQIVEFPTIDMKCSSIDLSQADFGEIPKEFLINNRNVNFGDIGESYNPRFIKNVLNGFLDKISNAEMNDFVISDDNNVEPNGLTRHKIEIRTNSKGVDGTLGNYRFNFNILTSDEDSSKLNSVLENIFQKIKAKKIYFGAGMDVKFKDLAKKINPTAIIDDSINVKNKLTK